MGIATIIAALIAAAATTTAGVMQNRANKKAGEGAQTYKQHLIVIQKNLL